MTDPGSGIIGPFQSRGLARRSEGKQYNPHCGARARARYAKQAVTKELKALKTRLAAHDMIVSGVESHGESTARLTVTTKAGIEVPDSVVREILGEGTILTPRYRSKDGSCIIALEDGAGQG